MTNHTTETNRNTATTVASPSTGCVRVLLTGFDKWEGSAGPNPSAEVVNALLHEGWTGQGTKTDTGTGIEMEIHGVLVPVVFSQMVDIVRAKIREVDPDIVIMMGEYPGRAMVTMERVALNLIDATRYGLADNTGVAPVNEEVVPGGPLALPASLPIRAMTLAMRKHHVPADISEAPGTFGCNLLFYGIMHALQDEEQRHQEGDVMGKTRNRRRQAGWIHLPSLPATAALDENLGMPSMDFLTQLQGIKAALRCAAASITASRSQGEHAHPQKELVTVRSRLQI
eukprot:Nk52_evm104s208 gene=Nk52_evmTU104s208